MESIYAVENESQLKAYQLFSDSIQIRLNEYLEHLHRNYAVTDLPRSILWSSKRIATELISNIPVPAYTNEYRIVMTPDIEVWRSIYLHQLDGIGQAEEIRNYYLHSLNQNHILQILGHELAHHSALFLDDFSNVPSDGIWFEEGMAEYISRKFFLTEEEFHAEGKINQRLVELLSPKYGNHSLEDFGSETYSTSYGSIFFEYWRSFLAVDRIIRNHENNVQSVFASYHDWYNAGSGKTLLEWFGL